MKHLKRILAALTALITLAALCSCGRKATVNARIDGNGRVVTKGAQVLIGGNDSYVAMCHRCWRQKVAEQESQISFE